MRLIILRLLSFGARASLSVALAGAERRRPDRDAEAHTRPGGSDLAREEEALPRGTRLDRVV